MSDPKKKPGVASRATVVVVVVLSAYPLSFGPACWFSCAVDKLTGHLRIFWPPLPWSPKCNPWRLSDCVLPRP